MKDSDGFIDLVHLASSLVDPRHEQAAADRLKQAVPAALEALAAAPAEQVLEWVRSARAAGLRFAGSDEDVARRIRQRRHA